MPSKELELKLTWENNVNFKCQAKRSDGEPGTWKTVVQADENGHIDTIWSALQSAIIAFTVAQLNDIGKEMKS